jgi:site-specific DNA-cytosine methylase
MRALELYSGIGGFAEAFAAHGEVVAAIDHNHLANQVYEQNHEHKPIVKNLESIRLEELERHQADLWWMSPPCQPYTIRGAQRDLDDPRSKSFLRILDGIQQLKPHAIALENVPWFEGSQAHALLLKNLRQLDYSVRQRQLCPTELGIPNLRKRFYLIACREPLRPIPLGPSHSAPLQHYLDPDGSEKIWVPEDLVRRYGDNLHTVDATKTAEIAACFTSAYGKSPVYCGSYLREGEVLRYFSPQEIARFLGFPENFSFPEEYSLRQLWKLVGNSLSVPAVRCVLQALPTR